MANTYVSAVHATGYTMTTDAVWHAWTRNTCCDYSTTTSDTVWRVWLNQGTGSSVTVTTSGTALTENVWRTWITNEQVSRVEVRPARSIVVEPTADEIRAREQRLQAERDLVAQRLAETRKAERRARGLLLATLTKEQRAQYEQHRYFDVVIEGKTYRVNHGSQGNVSLLDAKGTPIERYCALPYGVPTEDVMLAQKLALECNPREFFDKANVTRLIN